MRNTSFGLIFKHSFDVQQLLGLEEYGAVLPDGTRIWQRWCLEICLQGRRKEQEARLGFSLREAGEEEIHLKNF